MEIQSFYNQIEDFNLIALNGRSVTQEDIVAQAKLCLEEAKELFNAVNDKEGDAQVLKESIDLAVVCLGMLHRLELMVFEVSSACNVVGENNLTKFCKDRAIARYSQMAYEADGVEVNIVESRGYYALIDKNGKVRKPFGYEKADVSKFIPKGD